MLDLNVIYEGDCLEVMKEFPDKSIDLILTDLPYGTTACKWDAIIPFEPLWEQYKRIIKDNGAIVLTASQPFTSALVMSNIKMFKYCWYWYKNCPSGISLSRTQPMRSIEEIIVFCAGKTIFNKQLMPSKITDRKLGGKNGAFGNYSAKADNISGLKHFSKSKNNPDNILLEMVNPRNVLEINVEPRAKGTLHPTQKPAALFEYLIKTYTNEGDIVLDSCCGSGTTGIACQNLNRNFILIDKDPHWCDVTYKRLMENRDRLSNA